MHLRSLEGDFTSKVVADPYWRFANTQGVIGNAISALRSFRITFDPSAVSRTGDVFGFDLNGCEWKVVVSVRGYWAKILSRDERAEIISKQ